MKKQAEMIDQMTSELVDNVNTFAKAKARWYGAPGIGQNQTKTGIVRQIQSIRAALLELQKAVEQARVY